MLRGILYFLELLEIAQAEKGSGRELCAYSLFYFLGFLESLLLPIPETMDKFCRGGFGGNVKYILAGFINLLFAKGTKWQVIL